MVRDSEIRCPAADAAARREFSRIVKPPVPDTTDASGGAAISADAMKAKTDELRAAVIRKNQAGRRVLDQYERCRTGIAPATS